MEEELKPVETQEVRMGFVSRISGIFFEPKKVFNFLNFKPSWFFAAVLILVVGIIVAEIIMPQSAILQKEVVSQSTKISPEQMAKSSEITSLQRILAVPSGLIFGFIILIVFTSLVYFFCSIILGGDSSYTRVLSVVTYSSFIPTLGAVLKTPLILAKNSADVQTSLAVLMPGGQLTRISYILLSSLDVFSIWQVVLIGLGVTILYKFSMLKGLVAAFLGWGILVGIGVVLRIWGMYAIGVPVTW
jgi:hypothetical protein